MYMLTPMLLIQPASALCTKVYTKLLCFYIQSCSCPYLATCSKVASSPSSFFFTVHMIIHTHPAATITNSTMNIPKKRPRAKKISNMTVLTVFFTVNVYETTTILCSPVREGVSVASNALFSS